MDHESRPGDSNRITREYFDSLLLEMRHIDSVLPSTAFELYGQTFSTPVMTAALSHLKGKNESGMVEMAKGAKGADAVLWCGMGPEEELEAITATGAKTIKIIKPHQDNAVIFRKIRHAEKCGCLAVGMDVDHAFGGDGRYDNVLGLPMASKTLEEIRSFVKATRLPFIIKGVLSVKDAEKCLDAGVSGIVVSHHHGIMRCAVPPLAVLPEIVKAAGGRFPVFIDCCIDNGYDVFKALALGAAAVCAGRVLIDPIKAEGPEGARKTIAAMTAELAGVMARTGSPDIRHIDPAVVRRV